MKRQGHVPPDGKVYLSLGPLKDAINEDLRAAPNESLNSLLLAYIMVGRATIPPEAAIRYAMERAATETKRYYLKRIWGAFREIEMELAQTEVRMTDDGENYHGNFSGDVT